MLAIRIEHIKKFMSALLLRETFDTFLLSEASITTFAEFHIDGKLHKEYFDSGTADALSEEARSLVRWKDVKEHCFALIKGKRTPLSFRIIFQLPADRTEKLILSSGSPIAPEDVYGLFLNFQFRNNTLTLTTGTSLRTFTPDKTPELTWDKYMNDFLAHFDLD